MFTKRFYATVITNFSIAGVNFVISILLARFFSVAEFGNYQYLLSIFTSVFVFITFGTNTAYYTFISQHKESIGFHLAYFLWQFIQIVVTVFFLYLLDNTLFKIFFLDIDRALVLLAALALFSFNNLKTTVIYILESNRLTVLSQYLNLFIVLFHCFLILSFIFLNILTMKLIFELMIIEYFILFFLGIYILLKKNLYKETHFNVVDNFIRYLKYIKPLIVSMLIIFIYTFLDRWLLQTYAGAKEQAYFGIALRVSTIAIIVTTSVINIFWKEISEGIKNQDFVIVKKYFFSVTESMFIFTSMISLILFQFSDQVLLLFYGKKYIAASMVFKCMMLYPITQSLGQMYSSFFFATESTSTYSKVVSILSVFGIFISVFLMTPFFYNLGPIGLAFKMLIIGIITVCILGHMITKKYKWEGVVLKQIITLCIISLYSYIVYKISNLISNNLIIISMVVIGIYILPITFFTIRKFERNI